MKIRKKLSEFKEKVWKFKEKPSDIDKSLMVNWTHILNENASIRMTSRGIKIEYRQKNKKK
jgi:hypothetical protein